MKSWLTSRRSIALDHTLIMGVINVTPDSFSDGGEFLSPDDALRRAEKLLHDGADILDIGGESTRPGSVKVTDEVEQQRIIPVIGSIVSNFDAPISVDTTSSKTAATAIDAGAEIINDISGLRFDPHIADVAAATGAGLVVMHSIGTFSTLHSEPPVDDIFAAVGTAFRAAAATANSAGVKKAQIVFDVGIGFGKTVGQNLELIGKLDRMIEEFPEYPFLVGTSRKSFIGKISGASSPAERLGGSVATAVIAVCNGASVVRAHDVYETRQALQLLAAVKAAV